MSSYLHMLARLCCYGSAMAALTHGYALAALLLLVSSLFFSRGSQRAGMICYYADNPTDPDALRAVRH